MSSSCLKVKNVIISLVIIVFLLWSLSFSLILQKKSETPPEKKDVRGRSVIFDCDGNIDDFIALIALLKMKHLNLIGISVTPADCVLESGIEGVLQILSLFKIKIPVRGAFQSKLSRQFPYSFKLTGLRATLLPMMLTAQIDESLYDKAEPGHIFLAKKIKESKEPVTVLLTGPATTFVMAYEYDKKILDNVEEVVWMGGAIDVKGNVIYEKHDGSAEWNIFADPVSAKNLISNDKVKVTLVPLDATNYLPINKKLLTNFAQQQKYQISNLVSQMFAVAYFEAENHMASEIDDYYLWDVTAVGYLGCENMATFSNLSLDVKIEGPSYGKTFKNTLAENEKIADAHTVKVAIKIEQKLFMSYLQRLMLDDFSK